jgi:hypothetical protein
MLEKHMITKWGWMGISPTIMGYVMGNLKLGCRLWEYTRYTIPPTDAMSWSAVFFAGCTMVM